MVRPETAVKVYEQLTGKNVMISIAVNATEHLKK